MMLYWIECDGFRVSPVQSGFRATSTDRDQLMVDSINGLLGFDGAPTIQSINRTGSIDSIPYIEYNPYTGKPDE
jgi:hypothetical protein